MLVESCWSVHWALWTFAPARIDARWVLLVSVPASIIVRWVLWDFAPASDVHWVPSLVFGPASGGGTLIGRVGGVVCGRHFRPGGWGPLAVHFARYSL